MISKRIATSCLMASVALMPVTGPVRADGGDAVAGAIVGALIGGAIVNENNKKKARQSASARTYSRPSVSSAQRESNREIQTALNYFGFPVGTPDGAIGPKSRAAISDYQATLGYPATGQLSPYEQSLLLNSYNRAMAGGAMTQQQIAANPMGVRGLLLNYRNEMAGVAQPQMAGQPMPGQIPGQMPGLPAGAMTPGMPAPGVMAVAPTVMAPAVPVPAAPVPAAPVLPGAAPVLAATAPAAVAPMPALPSFAAVTPPATVSLAAHCDNVTIMAGTSGGFVTLATMGDPNAALNQQFCLARGDAIAAGEALAANVPNVTPEQIDQQCKGFVPPLAAQVAALSTATAPEVITQVKAYLPTTGMTPAQLSDTARICLSSGYRTDDMGVAVSSALILTASDQLPYAELLGHHLAQGIGAAARPDLAFDWYEMGLDAMGQGTAAVFAPAQADRNDLIRKAVYAVTGKTDGAALSPEAPAALPNFGLPAVPQLAPDAAPAPLPQAVTASATLAPLTAPVGAVPVDAPAMAMTATEGRSPIDALPLAAQLPFLLLRQ